MRQQTKYYRPWKRYLVIGILLVMLLAVAFVLFRQEIIDLVTGRAPESPRIVYSDGGKNLYIMDEFGNQARRLFRMGKATSIQHPTWSPDGQYIAFSAVVDGNEDIYRINTHGGNLQRLTTDPARDIHPAWSPSAPVIAFISERDDGPALFTVNAEGSSPKSLGEVTRGGRFPTWWPSGEWILYQKQSQNAYTLYVIRPNGTEQYVLTEKQIPGAEAKQVYTHPAVSPSGQFVTYIDGEKLKIMKSDASVDWDLAGEAANQKSSWSPEGGRVVYLSKGYSHIEIINVSSMEVTEIRDLPSETGMYLSVSWEPVKKDSP